MGAVSGDILKVVLRKGAVLAGIGILLGLAGSVALSRFLQGMLFAVGPFDLVTFVGLSAAVMGVALLAAFIPAMRALRVDPVVALKAE
jgi:ABC-type antimicrobial peptide transport system permease subunit